MGKQVVFCIVLLSLLSFTQGCAKKPAVAHPPTQTEADALLRAVRLGDVGTVKQCLQDNPNPALANIISDVSFPEAGMTFSQPLLQVAIGKHAPPLVEALVDGGANIRYQDTKGDTPFTGQRSPASSKSSRCFSKRTHR